jgi:threonine dehydrogenase-like Zn-dependent dehydrogenase
MGAALFGFSKLYGEVAGGQAELLRVPQADGTTIKVPEGPSDERFVYLSDVVPTAWQSVEYAGIPDGGSVAVFGLGPIGDMASRIAMHRGHRVIAVDLVPERVERARRLGAEVIDASDHDDVPAEIREMTDGRGPDSVIDAVGMEAHGSPGAGIAQQMAGILPKRLAQGFMQEAGVDRLSVLYSAIDTVRRGGTLSLIGVYGGMADPIPMLTLFDKQIQLRMGQANVKRWVDDIMPLFTGDGDPLGVEDFATHRMPLDQGPTGYDIFQKKQDGAIKILLTP